MYAQYKEWRLLEEEKRIILREKQDIEQRLLRIEKKIQELKIQIDVHRYSHKNN